MPEDQNRGVGLRNVLRVSNMKGEQEMKAKENVKIEG